MYITSFCYVIATATQWNRQYSRFSPLVSVQLRDWWGDLLLLNFISFGIVADVDWMRTLCPYQNHKVTCIEYLYHFLKTLKRQLNLFEIYVPTIHNTMHNFTYSVILSLSLSFARSFARSSALKHTHTQHLLASETISHMASALWFRLSNYTPPPIIHSATICESIVYMPFSYCHRFKQHICYMSHKQKNAIRCHLPAPFGSHIYVIFPIFVVALMILYAFVCFCWVCVVCALWLFIFLCYTVKSLARRTYTRSVEWISSVRNVSDISSLDSVRLSTQRAHQLTTHTQHPRKGENTSRVNKHSYGLLFTLIIQLYLSNKNSDRLATAK